ncbi:unnamed protein product [Microthlaspi erraticum]|uniref:Matrin-type domain-containing protein n=1 Tax=Microthlaspi erraticum TaxID=1685480 RepID=A0A6D2J9C9_9BRAS|nr:unnamed protein product [Microthlaspi erraticum]
MSGSTSLEAPPASPVDIGIRLEKIRCKHEEIERLEQLVMEDLKTEETCPMKQLLQGHRLRSLAKSIMLKSTKLVETYEKIEGDTVPLRFQSPSSTVSSAFSSRLKEILEYYGTHTCAPLVDYEAPTMEEPVIAFTAEECFGRYLELHDLHNQYINSSFGERVDYSAYLDVFSQPEKIPPKLKLSRQYTEYMEALLRYLICFFKRAHPLPDPDRILSKVEADLEEQYGAKKVGGLEKQGQENDLERLERKQLLMEAQVKKLCNLLDETIERTKHKGEALAFEVGTETESGAMGWDGKPVPYWLHKLGQVYECEICKNYGYAGKVAFERHFEEGRHQRQFRCLGIPITDKLNGVASIQEAKEIMGMSKRRRLHRPLNTDGKQQITEGKGPDEAPAMPTPGITSVLEKTVGILLDKGLKTERRIIELYGDVAGFEFLRSSDPHHAYYKHRLNELRARAHATGSAATRECSRERPHPAELGVSRAPLPREPHMFTCRLPEGITGKEVQVIKLTALFYALNGGCYWEGCSERWNKDPEFMKPTRGGSSRSSFFYRLSNAYVELASPPESLIETLRENAADVETVLGNCFLRLQWWRFVEERMEKVREHNAREDAIRCAPLPIARLMEMAQIASSIAAADSMITSSL